MNRRLAAFRAQRLVAFDLGTATAVAADAQRVHVEASLVAISTETGSPVAIGRSAEKMLGRTPTALTVVRPVEHGGIADVERASVLVSHLLSELTRERLLKPAVAFAVSDVVAPEARSHLRNAAAAASIAECAFVDAIVAAAWGAGLPAGHATGNLIVDIGAGKTQAAVVTLDGTAVSHVAAVGGDAVDEALAQHLEVREGLRVGQRTAEKLKRALAAMRTPDEQPTVEVTGSDVETGVPRTTNVAVREIRSALDGPLTEITHVVARALSETPPELAADIVAGAITLTGGAAYLPGIRDLIGSRTGRPVIVAERPALCVALGVLRRAGGDPAAIENNPSPHRLTTRVAFRSPRSVAVSARTVGEEEDTAENVVSSATDGTRARRARNVGSARPLSSFARIAARGVAKRLRFGGERQEEPPARPDVPEMVDPVSDGLVDAEVAELTALSDGYCKNRRFREAVTCANAAVTRARRLDDTRGQAAALLALAAASHAAGAHDMAVKSLEEAVAVAGAAGNGTAEATALARLANLYRRSEPDKALMYARAALAAEVVAPEVGELVNWLPELESDASTAARASTEEITLH